MTKNPGSLPVPDARCVRTPGAEFQTRCGTMDVSARSTKRLAAILALTIAASAVLGGCVATLGSAGPQVSDAGPGPRTVARDQVSPRYERLPIR